MFLKKFVNFFPFLVLISLVLVGYFLVPFGFFQQDEWLGLARFLQLNDRSLHGIFLNAFSSVGAHFTPLSTFVIYLLFSFFDLNYPMYAVSSLILHIVASFVFFLLARTIFKSFWLAFWAMLLFSVNAAGFQATAWPIADIGTHCATIFAFLSIIIFFKFISTSKSKFFVLSLFVLTISLLFKENAVGFFVLLPVMLFMFGSQSVSFRVKRTVIILLIGVIYLSFRMFAGTTGGSQSLAVQSSAPKLPKIAYNLFSIPVKATVQALVPSSQIYDLAFWATKFFPESERGEIGSPAYASFALKKVSEAANFLIFIGLAALFLISWKKGNGQTKQTLLFSGLFVFLNSLILAFTPEKEGIIFTVDSRNVYLISGGVIIFLITVIRISRRKLLSKFWILFLLFLVVLNIWWLNKQISGLVKEGQTRLGILNEIKIGHAVLPEKVIFYTQSNSSFYGLPTDQRIFPFQSGFGQTLLVWYHATENFPKDFFQNRFLWEIEDQGYKEAEKRGFGYFRDFNLLAKTVQEKNIPLESVIAFSYDSESRQLTDISTEIKGRLKGFIVPKRKLNQRAFNIKDSSNPAGVNLALDGKRETFWDSKIPYRTSTSLDIELDRPNRIAEVEIDSFNNKDQNEIGYEVSTSMDGNVWENVFYAKRHTPDSSGFTDIYFEPHEARFIRIKQAGYHNYASWVIHELNIYEAI